MTWQEVSQPDGLMEEVSQPGGGATSQWAGVTLTSVREG